MLESSPPRNSQPETHQTMSGGVGRRAEASIGWKDFPDTSENSYRKLPRSGSPF